MCSQQVDPSLFTDRKKTAEKKLFLHEPVAQKVKNSRRRRAENEKVKWRIYHVLKEVDVKSKCQSTWRTQSDAGVAIDTTVSVDGQHAISPTGPSRLSLSSFFFLNSRIVTLNPFQVRTLTTLSCFSSPRKNDFCVAGFGSEAHFQYFICTGFLFCGCRLPSRRLHIILTCF